MEFISAKAASKVKGYNNPDRQMIRYQFMEIFIRLAMQKFYKPKVVKTMEEAVEKLFEEHVLP